MELTGYISSAFESIFKRNCPRELLEASEGDARRYLKKVIENAGLAGELSRIYGPGWAGEAFADIRDRFVHQGCDVYFVPGLARILYGELGYGTGDADMFKVNELLALVKFISSAHKEDFSRNLENITTVAEGPRKGMKVRSEPFTFGQLHDMFSREQDDVTSEQRSELEKEGLADGGYEVVELSDFDTANRFLKYTETDDPHTSWCYLASEGAFEDYSKDGNRLYLALKPGFEDLEPGDPGYGRSMIGFDMGPVREDGTSTMMVCNDRYNHGKNLEGDPEAGTGDHAYSEIQLSRILGRPVWKDFPGYSREQLIANGRVGPEILKELIPDREALLDWKLNAGRYWQEYRVRAEDVHGMGPELMLRFDNRLGEQIAYAFADPETGEVVWASAFNQLPEGRRAVVENGRGVRMATAEGHLLTGYFDIIDSYMVHEFPLGVGVKREPGDGIRLRWNYVDMDGNLLLDEWLSGADKFNSRGRARVYRMDNKCAVIGKDMEPVTGWMDYIGKIAEDAFLLERDQKFNVLSGGKMKFDTWLMCFRTYGHMLAVIGNEHGFNLYNFVTDVMYPEWYYDMSVGSPGPVDGHFVVKVVRREDRKVNYIVEDGSLRDPEYELDTWLDAGGTLSGGRDTAYGILAGQKVKIEYEDGHVTIGEPVNDTGKGLYDW